MGTSGMHGEHGDWMPWKALKWKFHLAEDIGSVWVEETIKEKSCTETSTVRRSLGQRKQEDVQEKGGRGEE